MTIVHPSVRPDAGGRAGPRPVERRGRASSGGVRGLSRGVGDRLGGEPGGPLGSLTDPEGMAARILERVRAEPRGVPSRVPRRVLAWLAAAAAVALVVWAGRRGRDAAPIPETAPPSVASSPGTRHRTLLRSPRRHRMWRGEHPPARRSISRCRSSTACRRRSSIRCCGRSTTRWRTWGRTTFLPTSPAIESWSKCSPAWRADAYQLVARAGCCAHRRGPSRAGAGTDARSPSTGGAAASRAGALRGTHSGGAQPHDRPDAPASDHRRGVWPAPPPDAGPAARAAHGAWRTSSVRASPPPLTASPG